MASLRELSRRSLCGEGPNSELGGLWDGDSKGSPRLRIHAGHLARCNAWSRIGGRLGLRRRGRGAASAARQADSRRQLSGGSSGDTVCSATLTGKTTIKRSGLRLLDNMGLRIPTSRVPVGLYDVSVSCPPGKAARLNTVRIIPRRAATSPTCSVADSGFSYASGEAWVGYILRNANPYAPARDGDVINNLLDANGGIIATEGGGVGEFPAASTRPSGVSVYTSKTPSSVQVIFTCDRHGVPSVDVQFMSVPAEASATEGSVMVSGVFTNSSSKVVNGGQTYIRYVTRNTAGAVSGGDRVSLPSVSIPPGASVRWETTMYGMPGSQVATIEAVAVPAYTSD